MHRLMLNMGRQTLIHLLLACLLLTATRWHHSTATVQATDSGKPLFIFSVHFRFKPAQPNSRPGKRFVLPAWVDGEKVHKKPSGPNPVGNHRPPSRQ
ncbi:hypothetical protein TIFTF001_000506 [Ficus carica]|uniref:CLAVATA3/ESR (CLE)-related protein 46 n=1 Tax=Ficus carica TaxID=3494 RepID=A0AA87ZDK2_FICCA|nr:hypothetical protein TIFTF001_000506 [Ficus carica]